MIVTNERTYLVTGRLRVAEWSFQSYGAELEIADREVEALTPESTIGAVRHGFEPLLHPTAPKE